MTRHSKLGQAVTKTGEGRWAVAGGGGLRLVAPPCLRRCCCAGCVVVVPVLSATHQASPFFPPNDHHHTKSVKAGLQSPTPANYIARLHLYRTFAFWAALVKLSPSSIEFCAFVFLHRPSPPLIAVFVLPASQAKTRETTGLIPSSPLPCPPFFCCCFESLEDQSTPDTARPTSVLSLPAPLVKRCALFILRRRPIFLFSRRAQ